MSTPKFLLLILITSLTMFVGLNAMLDVSAVPRSHSGGSRISSLGHYAPDVMP